MTRADTFSYVTAFNDVGRPTGLMLDTIDGVPYLYVSDHDGGRVFRFNLTDGSRVQIAERGAANGQFVAPDAIAVEPATHDLYIADRTLHRVTRLTRTGAFVMKWGDTGTQTNRFGNPGAGTAPGQFNAPVGLALDAAGNVYTTEHENHRVQKFRVTQSGGTWNVETLAVWGSGGSGPGQFNTPYGITLDPAGNVWVADGFNSRLQKFTPNGELLGQIVVRGATEPHLVNTWVTFDTAGSLYVGITSDPNTGGDIANQRIEKFSPGGVSLGRWGSYGGGPGQFRLPFGIVIHAATNRAYVTDYDNNRVQVFEVGAPIAAPPPPPPASPPPTSPPVTSAASRLVNISTRGFVGTGERQLVAGFVVSGDADKRILIRGIGPGLTEFGVADRLADPVLALHASGNAAVVAQNDNWETPWPVTAGQSVAPASEISAAAAAAGAFALVAGSRDASLVITLPPGSYTAVLSGANNATGVGLLEIFELPAP